MRRPPLLGAAAACLSLSMSIALPAFAITEPDGTSVPIDSGPGEIQLYQLFTSRNDPIDWQADASDMPGTFSPACGFTATYVLNQAGSHFGLAWYNATGSAPQAADLHQIMPPNSMVGTIIMSADIKNDPAYAGGLVGFALIGGQTHYTEFQWDIDYWLNNEPWITALIYASKNTPSAYYIAFEDGTFSTFSFGNDGDFNDDVFFVTGVSNCSGGGAQCNTGKPGICAPGITQCSAGGAVPCVQLNQPAAMEICNGLDDDCNGLVDDGMPCATGFVCDQGACVPKCNGGEFNCAPSTVCNAAGNCVDPKCAKITCASGSVCSNGVCKAPCDGVTCPYPQICAVDTCVDPCVSAKCGADQVCTAGVCLPTCTCSPCAAGKSCDKTSGACVDPMCVGVMCGAGYHCVTGTCTNDCAGAVCPADQVCESGACVASAGGTSSGAATGGTTSSGTNIFAGAGGGSANVGTGGIGGAQTGGATGAGGVGGAGGGSGATQAKPSGCGCRVAGGVEDDEMLVAGALAFIAARSRRKQRKQRNPANQDRSMTR